MNDRKVIMALGWVWGILGLPTWLVLVVDACLSMRGPWWLFFGTVAVFAWWAYLLLTAFVAPCPFKADDERLRLSVLRHITNAALDAGVNISLAYKRGHIEVRTTTPIAATRGKVTQVWE